MRLPPFRSLLLRGGAASEGKYAMPCAHLTHFGDVAPLRAALHLTNLLTGYVFLVDAQGRQRWRASGNPSPAELDTLLRVTDQLLGAAPGGRAAAAAAGQQQQAAAAAAAAEAAAADGGQQG